MYWLIAFLCGAIVLMLEIIAPRILQPQFGSGVTTWASVIGVFLGALSVGYYLGGYLGDRFPTLTGLGFLLYGAALSIALVPVLNRLFFPPLEVPLENPFPVPAENIFERFGGRYGVVLAVATLFWVPSMFLATTSPYLIRLASKSVATAGRTAGSIYAVSTVGSIVGTLLCAFVVLPHWGVNAVLMQLTLATAIIATLCVVLGLKFPWRWGRGGLVVLFGFSFLSFADARVLYERESLYHRIIVEEVGGIRYLRFDASYQSALDLKDPDRPVFLYTDYLHLGLIFKPDAQKVLFIGLGGGIAPRKFHKDYPDMTIHIVELDPAVKEVAEKFFGFREDERMKVFIADGRVYLRRGRDTYDLIVLDAYHGSPHPEEVPLPAHMTTKEFWGLLRSRLTRTGALVFNLVGRLEGRRSRLTRAIIKTLWMVFPEVYVFPVEYQRLPWLFGRRNLILIAPNRPMHLTPSLLIRRARKLVVTGRVKVTGLPLYAADLYRRRIPTHDVPVLTDDYAPVEFLNP